MEQTDLIRRARYGPNTILAAGMSRALNTALNSAESELLLLVLILDRDSGTHPGRRVQHYPGHQQ